MKINFATLAQYQELYKYLISLWSSSGLSTYP